MLREIIEALKAKNELATLIDEFAEMLGRSAEIVREASGVYFAEPGASADGQAFHSQDVKINKLERKIRKRIVWLLAGQSDGRDAPTGLLLMSLVKDAERIGDYAKDLAQLVGFAGGAAPGPPADRLRGLAGEIGSVVDALPRVFRESDQAAAVQLVRQSRDLDERCEAHIRALATEPPFAGIASALLAAQFYRRILGHAMNVLSGLVNPLHRLDFHDDKDMLAEIQVGETTQS